MSNDVRPVIARRTRLGRWLLFIPASMLALSSLTLIVWGAIEARNPEPIAVTTFPKENLRLSRGLHILAATLFNPRLQPVKVAILAPENCGCISDADRSWKTIGPLQSAEGRGEGLLQAIGGSAFDCWAARKLWRIHLLNPLRGKCGPSRLPG